RIGHALLFGTQERPRLVEVFLDAFGQHGVGIGLGFVGPSPRARACFQRSLQDLLDDLADLCPSYSRKRSLAGSASSADRECYAAFRPVFCQRIVRLPAQPSWLPTVPRGPCVAGRRLQPRRYPAAYTARAV